MNHRVEGAETLCPLTQRSVHDDAANPFDSLTKGRFELLEVFPFGEHLREVSTFQKSGDLDERVGLVDVLRTARLKGAAPDLRGVIIDDEGSLRMSLADENFESFVEGGACVVRFLEHRRDDFVEGQRKGADERRETSEELDALGLVRGFIEERHDIEGVEAVHEGTFIHLTAELEPGITSAKLFANEGEEPKGIIRHVGGL